MVTQHHQHTHKPRIHIHEQTRQTNTNKHILTYIHAIPRLSNTTTHAQNIKPHNTNFHNLSQITIGNQLHQLWGTTGGNTSHLQQTQSYLHKHTQLPKNMSYNITYTHARGRYSQNKVRTHTTTYTFTTIPTHTRALSQIQQARTTKQLTGHTHQSTDTE